MREKKDCGEVRRYLQDCLDRGQAPAGAAAHLSDCPECRAWQETLAGAASGLRAALTDKVAGLPPPNLSGLWPRILTGRPQGRPQGRPRSRRLAAVAAALVLAAGLSAATAGLIGRRRSPAPSQAGGDYLLEVVFTDSLLLDRGDPGLVLEGNGGSVWPAGTLESEELYTMEPLTLF